MTRPRLHPSSEPRFSAAADDLDALRDPLRQALGRVDRRAARQAGPLLEITGDLVAFSDVLLEVHRAAVAFETAQEAALTAVDPSPRPMRVVRRLHATYRSFFFLSRELQDHAYGALLATCAGATLSGSPSMKNANGTTNPVRLLLDESVPGYWEWFARWRALRNRLKDGASVSLVGPVSDLGIEFSIMDGDHAGQHKIRLGDASETLEWSAAIVRAVIARFAGEEWNR
jgi:hypothetical protein